MNVLFRPVSWTCRTSSFFIQQVRTTVMVHRMYPVPAYKGYFPRQELKKKEQILVFETDTNAKPQGNLDLILLADIEGIGSCGQITSVPKRFAWHDLLVSGAAVYVTQDNLTKYSELIEAVKNTPRQTPTGRRTIRELQSMTLPIAMSATTQWTLNEQHVRIAFRNVGVHLDSSSIGLPKDPITGPGQCEVYVTVNQLDKVPVKAVVYQYNAKRPELNPVIQAWPSVTDTVAVGTVLSPIYTPATRDLFLSKLTAASAPAPAPAPAASDKPALQ